ncbi:MAG: hypothetical protein MJ241_01095 [Bacilli bacterium]|nr:hypothetical protein [Bacilli bacterium]
MSSEPVDGPESSQATHRHSYGEWKVTKEPTCTEKGSKERTCECGDKQTQSVSAAGHKYVEQEGGKLPTCTEAGEKIEKCSVCGDEKKTPLDPLDHDYIKSNDQDGAVLPDCENPGTEIQECTRCHDKKTVDVPETGHTWGEDHWTKNATCTDEAEGTHKCETCSKEEAITSPALGHDIQLIGDETEPEPGKAKVRLYTCAHEGCEQTYLGFKANEVSEESKKKLVIGEDGGARFFGQPIGNKCDLKDSSTCPHLQQT